jgi:ElaB/YqjD/DUF883 family membrane-anchored ribosome-binding protein
MIEPVPTANIPATSDVNLVDRAARSADQALEATRRATGAVIDGVADKVHALQEKASPALDRLNAPFESASRYTQEAPLKALLAAAAVGATLISLMSMLRRRPARRRRS